MSSRRKSSSRRNKLCRQCWSRWYFPGASTIFFDTQCVADLLLVFIKFREGEISLQVTFEGEIRMNPFTTLIAFIVGCLVLYLGIRDKNGWLIGVAMIPLAIVAYSVIYLIIQVSA